MLLRRQAIRLASHYSADVILSPENRARCLKCLKDVAKMRVRSEKSDESVNTKFASVLVPVCVDEIGQTSILYTRRSGLLSRHVHQISFPGGIKDPEDASFEDCALRETEEEIGLPRSRIEIWGSGPMITPPGNATIMPVYATVKNLDLEELKLNKTEVESAFTISLSELTAPENFRHTQFKDGFSTPAFIIGNRKVWGITGWLTYSFLHCFLPKIKFRPKIKYVRPYRAR